MILNGIGVRIMLPDWVERLPVPCNRRFNDACDSIRAAVANAIATLQACENDAGAMLSMLPLTDQVCSEVLSLALAATETTATVLTWVLYELARHPRWVRLDRSEGSRLVDVMLHSRGRGSGRGRRGGMWRVGGDPGWRGRAGGGLFV